MARSYGQIYAGIWRDPDFRALPMAAQWAYFMLATQGDISSCGLLSMTLGRWSNYTSDLSRDGLSDGLSTLMDHRFVIVDDDTEEVLVRTFAKWDGGSTNSKRIPAITAAANAVVSPILRGILAVELNKLGVPHSITDTPPDALSHRASNSPSDNPRIQALVTERNQDLNPESLNLNPEPVTMTGTGAGTSIDVKIATAPQSPAPTVNQRAQRLTTAYTDLVPLSKFPAVLGIAKKAIQSNRYTDQQIHDALVRLAGEGRSLTVETLRIELDGQPPPRNGRPTGDDKVRAGLDLAERLAAERNQPRQHQLGA